MLELIDPKNIDSIAYGSGLLNDIRQFSLLPDKRIGWNYPMDYTWIATKFEEIHQEKGMVIIDIGCGPGAIHGYLENKYGLNIIGVDVNKWDNDYVDIVGDFSDPQFREENGIEDESVDIIISSSAFEHNSIEDHRSLVQVCKKCLKQEGYLITTFAASKSKNKYWKKSHQWNLNRKTIEEIYSDTFTEYNWKEVHSRYRNHAEMGPAYSQRYGFKWYWEPSFVSVGAFQRKN